MAEIRRSVQAAMVPKQCWYRVEISLVTIEYRVPPSLRAHFQTVRRG